MEGDEDGGLLGPGEGGPGDLDASVTDSGAKGDASIDASIDGSTDGGETNPCEGVTCNAPPANACADAENLRVYESVGTCDEGECQYDVTVQPCPGGCQNGACKDDPCIGVSCNTAPSPKCKDETFLTVYEAPGACHEGTCSYASQDIPCTHGCVNNACKDDPCAGVTCTTPSANYCAGDVLISYAASGTCNGGSCSYTQSQQTCTFGCEAGKCKADPCAGKSCNTPPARTCDGNKARIYGSPGTCSQGSCQYPVTEQDCPYGCENGFCKDCAGDGDCGSGKWCNNGTCASCNNDLHCGASCTNCFGSGQKCGPSGTCVQCVSNNDCGSDKKCVNNQCVTCDTAQYCGASCTPCSGTTPHCNGTRCVCDATSCGPGATCDGVSCVTCNTTQACGPSCEACTGERPVCGGTGVGCICNEGSCGAGKFCNGTSCQACAAVCGDGVCDAVCGETEGTCPADCALPACPVGMEIGAFSLTDEPDWTYKKSSGLWRYLNGQMVAGSGINPYGSSYVENLTWTKTVDLRSCASPKLSFRVRLSDDAEYNSDPTDKSERLYVECSGDGGGSWTTLTPNPWPSNQSACSNSYCAGRQNLDRSFPLTSQNITLPQACQTATVTFRFRAQGSSAWRLNNPGWYVDDVTVN